MFSVSKPVCDIWKRGGLYRPFLQTVFNHKKGLFEQFVIKIEKVYIEIMYYQKTWKFS